VDFIKSENDNSELEDLCKNDIKSRDDDVNRLHNQKRSGTIRTEKSFNDYKTTTFSGYQPSGQSETKIKERSTGNKRPTNFIGIVRSAEKNGVFKQVSTLYVLSVLLSLGVMYRIFKRRKS